MQSQAICAPGAHEGDSKLLSIGLLALAMQSSAPCAPELAPRLLLRPLREGRHLRWQLAASKCHLRQTRGTAGLLQTEVGQVVVDRLLPDCRFTPLAPGIKADTQKFFATHVLPAAGYAQLAHEILRCGLWGFLHEAATACGILRFCVRWNLLTGLPLQPQRGACLHLLACAGGPAGRGQGRKGHSCGGAHRRARRLACAPQSGSRPGALGRARTAAGRRSCCK